MSGLFGLLATGPVIPIDPPTLPWTGPTNLVLDGNSIPAGQYSSIGTFDLQLMMYEPLLSSGASHSCFALPGHNWQNMLDGAEEVDAAWMPGATNVLLAWETTNTAADTSVSPEYMVGQIQTYIDGRLALHPGWKILLGGSLPRGGTSAYEDWNTKMEAVDAYLADHWEEMGAAGFVDFRAAHPAYNHHGTTAGPFNAYLDFWHEQMPQFIHPTDIGKVPLAQAVNAAIAALPA